MNLKMDEIIMTLAAGILAGLALGFLAKQFPDSGIGTL